MRGVGRGVFCGAPGCVFSHVLTEPTPSPPTPSPTTAPYPPEGNPLLSELAGYLDASGLYDPSTKIYITSEPLPFLPALLFLFTAAQLNRLVYDRALGALAGGGG